MNIFTICFLKNCRTQEQILHHSLKFLVGACPRTPLAYEWLRHALHDTKRYANRLTFLKKIIT